MKNRLILISIVCSVLFLGGSAASAQAQLTKPVKNSRKAPNFAGRWKGKLYQPEGTAEQKYNFRMTLRQKGTRITGFSRIAVIGSPQYYGVIRLRGTLRRNRLVFREIKITQDAAAPGTFWCIKSGGLKLTSFKGKTRLTGAWQAPNCAPGTVALTRISRKP